MKARITKIISVIVSISFLTNGAVFAQPQISPQPTAYNQPQTSIYIPEQYGKIEPANRQTGKQANSPTVILIKDAHCHYEAQRNIAKILDILIKEYGIDLIGVEGAGGKVDPSIIGNSKDEKKRKQVADKYLKKGWLTAGEALAIERGNDYGFSIFGAEDIKLYLRDLKAFRDVYNGNAEAQGFIEKCNGIISNLKGRLYSKAILDYDKKIKDYRANEISLTELIQFLYKTDKQGFIKQKNLKLVLKAVRLEKAIDFKKVEKERTDLIKECEKRFPKEDIQALVQKSLLYRLGRIPALDYYKYLERYVDTSKIHLRRYTRNLKIHSMIDENGLFGEIDTLIEDIYSRFLTDELSVKLHKIDEYLYLLDKLLRLEITRDELERYRGSDIKIDEAVNFLSIQAKTNIDVPDSFMKQPEEFYRYAIERDNALIENLIKRMEEQKKDKAVLIIGGFHADGAEKLLKEKGIEVITITPSITKEDTEARKNYLSRIMDERINPEKMLAGLGNIGAAVATADVWKGQYRVLLDQIIREISGELKSAVETALGESENEGEFIGRIKEVISTLPEGDLARSILENIINEVFEDRCADVYSEAAKDIKDTELFYKDETTGNADKETIKGKEREEDAVKWQWGVISYGYGQEQEFNHEEKYRLYISTTKGTHFEITMLVLKVLKEKYREKALFKYLTSDKNNSKRRPDDLVDLFSIPPSECAHIVVYFDDKDTAKEFYGELASSEKWKELEKKAGEEIERVFSEEERFRTLSTPVGRIASIAQGTAEKRSAKAGGGLIGKIIDIDGNLITDGISGSEVSGPSAGKTQLVLLKDGRGLTDQGWRTVMVEIIRVLSKDEGGLYISPILSSIRNTGTLSLLPPGMEQYINNFLPGKEIKIIAENDIHIRGFCDGNTIYIRESLLSNPIALFHELGEGFYRQNPKLLPKGINAHTYLRGVGKDARKVFDSLEKKRFDTAEDLINALKNGMKRILTSNEENLIRFNWEKNDKGLRSLYGLQDRVFTRKENEEFTGMINELTGIIIRDSSVGDLIKMAKKHHERSEATRGTYGDVAYNALLNPEREQCTNCFRQLAESATRSIRQGLVLEEKVNSEGKLSYTVDGNNVILVTKIPAKEQSVSPENICIYLSGGEYDGQIAHIVREDNFKDLADIGKLKGGQTVYLVFLSKGEKEKYLRNKFSFILDGLLEIEIDEDFFNDTQEWFSTLTNDDIDYISKQNDLCKKLRTIAKRYVKCKILDNLKMGRSDDECKQIIRGLRLVEVGILQEGELEELLGSLDKIKFEKKAIKRKMYYNKLERTGWEEVIDIINSIMPAESDIFPKDKYVHMRSILGEGNFSKLFTIFRNANFAVSDIKEPVVIRKYGDAEDSKYEVYINKWLYQELGNNPVCVYSVIIHCLVQQLLIDQFDESQDWYGGIARQMEEICVGNDAKDWQAVAKVICSPVWIETMELLKEIEENKIADSRISDVKNDIETLRPSLDKRSDYKSNMQTLENINNILKLILKNHLCKGIMADVERAITELSEDLTKCKNPGVKLFIGQNYKENIAEIERIRSEIRESTEFNIRIFRDYKGRLEGLLKRVNDNHNVLIGGRGYGSEESPNLRGENRGKWRIWHEPENKWLKERHEEGQTLFLHGGKIQKITFDEEGKPVRDRSRDYDYNLTEVKQGEDTKYTDWAKQWDILWEDLLKRSFGGLLGSQIDNLIESLGIKNKKDRSYIINELRNRRLTLVMVKGYAGLGVLGDIYSHAGRSRTQITIGEYLLEQLMQRSDQEIQGVMLEELKHIIIHIYSQMDPNDHKRRNAQVHVDTPEKQKEGRGIYHDPKVVSMLENLERDAKKAKKEELARRGKSAAGHKNKETIGRLIEETGDITGKYAFPGDIVNKMYALLNLVIPGFFYLSGENQGIIIRVILLQILKQYRDESGAAIDIEDKEKFDLAVNRIRPWLFERFTDKAFREQLFNELGLEYDNSLVDALDKVRNRNCTAQELLKAIHHLLDNYDLLGSEEKESVRRLIESIADIKKGAGLGRPYTILNEIRVEDSRKLTNALGRAQAAKSAECSPDMRAGTEEPVIQRTQQEIARIQDRLTEYIYKQIMLKNAAVFCRTLKLILATKNNSSTIIRERGIDYDIFFNVFDRLGQIDRNIVEGFIANINAMDRLITEAGRIEEYAIISRTLKELINLGNSTSGQADAAVSATQWRIGADISNTTDDIAGHIVENPIITALGQKAKHHRAVRVTKEKERVEYINGGRILIGTVYAEIAVNYTGHYGCFNRVIIVEPETAVNVKYGFYDPKQSIAYVIKESDMQTLGSIIGKASHEGRHGLDSVEYGRQMNNAELEYTARLATLAENPDPNEIKASFIRRIEEFIEIVQFLDIPGQSIEKIGSHARATLKIIKDFMDECPSTSLNEIQMLNGERIREIAKKLLERFYVNKFGNIPAYPNISDMCNKSLQTGQERKGFMATDNKVRPSREEIREMWQTSSGRSAIGLSAYWDYISKDTINLSRYMNVMHAIESNKIKELSAGELIRALAFFTQFGREIRDKRDIDNLLEEAGFLGTNIQFNIMASGYSANSGYMEYITIAHALDSGLLRNSGKAIRAQLIARVHQSTIPAIPSPAPYSEFERLLAGVKRYSQEGESLLPVRVVRKLPPPGPSASSAMPQASPVAPGSGIEEIKARLRQRNQKAKIFYDEFELELPGYLIADALNAGTVVLHKEENGLISYKIADEEIANRVSQADKILNSDNPPETFYVMGKSGDLDKIAAGNIIGFILQGGEIIPEEKYWALHWLRRTSDPSIAVLGEHGSTSGRFESRKQVEEWVKKGEVGASEIGSFFGLGENNKVRVLSSMLNIDEKTLKNILEDDIGRLAAALIELLKEDGNITDNEIHVILEQAYKVEGIFRQSNITGDTPEVFLMKEKIAMFLARRELEKPQTPKFVDKLKEALKGDMAERAGVNEDMVDGLVDDLYKYDQYDEYFGLMLDGIRTLFGITENDKDADRYLRMLDTYVYAKSQFKVTDERFVSSGEEIYNVLLKYRNSSRLGAETEGAKGLLSIIAGLTAEYIDNPEAFMNRFGDENKKRLVKQGLDVLINRKGLRRKTDIDIPEDTGLNRKERAKRGIERFWELVDKKLEEAGLRLPTDWQNNMPLVVDAKLLSGDMRDSAVWLFKQAASNRQLYILSATDEVRQWLSKNEINANFIQEYSEVKQVTAVAMLAEGEESNTPENYRVITGTKEGADMMLMSRMAGIMGEDIMSKDKMETLFKAYYGVENLNDLTNDEIKQAVDNILKAITQGTAFIIKLPPISPFIEAYYNALKNAKDTTGAAA